MKQSSAQKGSAHLLFLFLAAAGILVYLVISSTFPFKDKLFSLLYPKPLSQAGETVPKTVKILEMRYFPLNSSGNIDHSQVGPSAELPILRQNVNSAMSKIIPRLNNGSKFRGYKNPSVPAYLNYQVVTSREFLKPLPPVNSAVSGRPDYKKILTEDVNICNLVDINGVRQVWLWGYHAGKIVPTESNMSMGTKSRAFWNYSTYGDVSNSERSNDLPICQNTYTVFNYSYTGAFGADSANYPNPIEDHSHQIESVFSFVDSNLYHLFVNPYGRKNGVVNHCGWSHSPPNSTLDYDWRNETIVKSDCEDWKPDGGGEVKDFNCHTFAGSTCIDDGGATWKIWWMQSIPGFQNNLTYQGKLLRNWWEFIEDFDEALKQGKSLVVGSAVPATPQPTPSPTFPPIYPSNRTYNGAFVTSNLYTGDLGGLIGADSKCQERANAAKLGGKWKAWLSDSQTSASSRLSHSLSVYKLMNGTMLAETWTDLTNGSIQARFDVTEFGNKVTVAESAWSNTTPSGLLNSGQPLYSCQNWTKGSTPDGGYVGNTNEIGGNWSSGGLYPCDARLRLYCLEQPYTPPVSPTPTPTPTPISTPAPSPTPNPTAGSSIPTVKITYPGNYVSIKRYTPITIIARALDINGIQKVEFRVNARLICTSTSTTSNFTCNWSITNDYMTYNIEAKAYNKIGKTTVNRITVFAK